MSIACLARSPLHAEIKCTDKPRSARRVGRALLFKHKKSLKPKKQRKSRVLYHFTKQELEPYFHISQKEAAKRLGVAVITLKRICKRGQFNWPYRANKTKETHERSSYDVPSPPRRLPAKRSAVKTRLTKKATAVHKQLKAEIPQQRPLDDPHPTFDGESRATQAAMRDALRSLALCAFQLEQDETEQAKMTAAAMNFSRLPLLCMLENEDTIVL